jgi:hypothetical protein
MESHGRRVYAFLRPARYLAAHCVGGPNTISGSCVMALPGSHLMSAMCARETAPRGLAWLPQAHLAAYRQPSPGATNLRMLSMA